MMIFHGNLRKITEIIENFVAKILKICLKKMYTLNRYAGNTSVPGAGTAADADLRRQRRRRGLKEMTGVKRVHGDVFESGGAESSCEEGESEHSDAVVHRGVRKVNYILTFAISKPR